jgi:hypothetical protein
MAELIEDGLDPIGFESLGKLWIEQPGPGRCPELALVLIDQAAVRGGRRVLLDLARSRYRGVPFIQLASSSSAVVTGAWDMVLHRPLSIADLIVAVRAICGRAQPGRERTGAAR